MAGYMTKLQGYVYDGSHQAAAALANGVFVQINASNKVAAPANAVTSTKFRVEEKTTLFGLPAVRLTVTAMGATDAMCITENEWDVNDGAAYDLSTYTVPQDALCRIHPLLPGEQCIVSVTSSVANTLAVGDTANVAANGTIVKTA